MKKLLLNRIKINKLILLIIIVIGLTPLFYFVSVEIGIAQAASEKTMVSESKDKSIDRYVENVAFGINEKLSFEINYGFINAGKASMEVVRLIEYKNRPCYQLVTRALSNSFFSTFYEVDDRVESIVDARGIFSWRFEKRLREGKYQADKEYIFDQHQNLAFYGKDTFEVSGYVHDALSSLYYIRTQNLEIGKSIYLENFSNGKKYLLEVKVLKRETINVPAGNFDCIVVEPLLQSVGVFKHQGSLTVWLTDDKLKMPVLMKSKVLVGSISAELTDYQLGDIEIF